MKYSVGVLGGKIKIERNKLGLSRESLAEVLNISSSFLGLVERGERKLSLENLCVLAETLNLPIDTFLSVKQTSEIHDSIQDYTAEKNLHKKQLMASIHTQLISCSPEELKHILTQIELMKKLIFETTH